MSTIRYWVWLSGLHGLRPKTRNRLLEHLGGPQEIYFADLNSVREIEDISPEETALLADKSLEQADWILERCQRQGIQILTLQDANYPRRLTHIYDPPAVLYVQGRLPWIDEQCAIAIVGTRKATPYGIKMGRQFGCGLAAGGALIISGLAEGVDSAGAQGALQAGGACVGVLGTAIDEIYPRFNRALFEDVAAVGALVSEYPPGTPFSRSSFPRRNRIIAGLSCGVTVIEAPERSGALITAARAMESGRDVFAVPGNADSPNCRGSNALIRDGAKAVSDAWDVLGDYTGRFPSLRPPQQAQMDRLRSEPVSAISAATAAEIPTSPVHSRETGEDFVQLRRQTETGKAREEARRKQLESQLEQLTEQQLKLLGAITKPETQVDEIILQTGLPAAAVLADLTLLQIKGFVSQSRGKHFSLRINLMK